MRHIYASTSIPSIPCGVSDMLKTSLPVLESEKALLVQVEVHLRVGQLGWDAPCCDRVGDLTPDCTVDQGAGGTRPRGNGLDPEHDEEAADATRAAPRISSMMRAAPSHTNCAAPVRFDFLNLAHEQLAWGPRYTSNTAAADLPMPPCLRLRCGEIRLKRRSVFSGASERISPSVGGGGGHHDFHERKTPPP
jgi:hypothetical protein